MASFIHAKPFVINYEGCQLFDSLKVFTKFLWVSIIRNPLKTPDVTGVVDKMIFFVFIHSE